MIESEYTCIRFNKGLLVTLRRVRLEANVFIFCVKGNEGKIEHIGKIEKNQQGAKSSFIDRLLGARYSQATTKTLKSFISLIHIFNPLERPACSHVFQLVLCFMNSMATTHS
jgi:hypothetical protein